MCPVCVAKMLTSSAMAAGPAGAVAAMAWSKIRLKKKEKEYVVRRDA